MAAIDTTSALAVQDLRGRVKGIVSAPGMPGWDAARQPWNVAFDQRPAAVVFAADPEDVAAVVRFARDSGLRVAPQGTGHNPGPLGDLSDSILLRTSQMSGVEIDPYRRIARVQAGALWRDLMIPASEHGLSGLAGSSPDVGVVGYSLGGGTGYLGRKHGLATNSVTAIELVTADGELVRTDAEHDPDLFWALRGGGGNFGAVTAMELSLYPLASVYAGALMWPWEESERVFKRWLEWIETVPDEITSMMRMIQFPPLELVPEPMRGRNLAVFTAAYAGDEGQGAELLRPLRELRPEIDMFADMPPAGLIQVHGDPEEPVPALSDTSLLDGLTPGAIDALMSVAGPGTESPLAIVEIRQLGGALKRSEPHHGALERFDAEFLTFFAGMPEGPDLAEAIRRRAHEVVAALAPYGSGRNYLNFVEGPADTRSFYPVGTHERLRDIRGKVDPDGLFRANHEIPPAE
jgi:hypothetical protein